MDLKFQMVGEKISYKCNEARGGSRGGDGSAKGVKEEVEDLGDVVEGYKWRKKMKKCLRETTYGERNRSKLNVWWKDERDGRRGKR